MPEQREKTEQQYLPMPNLFSNDTNPKKPVLIKYTVETRAESDESDEEDCGPEQPEYQSERAPRFTPSTYRITTSEEASKEDIKLSKPVESEDSEKPTIVTNRSPSLENSAARQSLSQQSTSQQITPKQSTPRQSSFQQTPPQQTALQGTLQQGQQNRTQSTSTRRETPQPTSPQQNGSQQNVSQQNGTQQITRGHQKSGRRRKGRRSENIRKSEDVNNYMGNRSIEELLKYIS